MMNNKLSKLLLVGVLVLLLGSFSGFAQDEAETEITFWYSLSGQLGETIEELVTEFNNSQDEIFVETNYAGGYSAALQQLKLAVQSGDEPHIFQSYGIGSTTMVDTDSVISLTELSEKFPEVQLPLADFIPTMKSAYTINDLLYAFPFANSNPLLYYNKDKFREAGLDPEDPPSTFEELEEYAKKLTIKEDGELEQVGASWAIRSWLMEQLIAKQNALFANEKNGTEGTATKVLYNEGPGLKILRMWNRLHENNYYINPGRSWSDARNNFASGLSAMMLQSTAGIQRTLNAIDGRFEMDTAPLPRPKDSEKGGVSVSGSALWVLKDHPEPELKAAWKFINFMASKSSQKHWHTGTGYLPVRESVIEELEEEGYYEENPYRYTAIEQLTNSPRSPATAGAKLGPFPEIREHVEQAIEKTLSGDLSPKEALDQAASKSNEALQRYKMLQEY